MNSVAIERKGKEIASTLVLSGSVIGGDEQDSEGAKRGSFSRDELIIVGN